MMGINKLKNKMEYFTNKLKIENEEWKIRKQKMLNEDIKDCEELTRLIKNKIKDGNTKSESLNKTYSTKCQAFENLVKKYEPIDITRKNDINYIDVNYNESNSKIKINLAYYMKGLYIKIYTLTKVKNKNCILNLMIY
jgi:hypothetical protein